MKIRLRFSCLSLAVLLGACSGTDTPGAGAAGGANTGGNLGIGGTTTAGGTEDMGGTTTVGGTTSNGNSSSVTGGATASGTGGSTSVATGTGGSAGTGGKNTAGGAAVTGGAAAIGGSAATGGGAVTGGAASVGGSAATGGIVATGGTTSAAGAAGVTGLKVVGNTIQNGQGQSIKIHGVNRSGTEYECAAANSNLVFDGPATDASIVEMATWKINAVRIPLNEDCWLGINGIAAAVAGTNYQTAIEGYVTLLHNHNIIPILDLHWAAPGTTKATAEQPMPDADHTPTFWTSVATAFAADSGVIFELYNEPYPNGNTDNAAAWTCWRDGGCTDTLNTKTGTGTYTDVGMQTLVNAVRTAGANNVLLLGGVRYSNALTSWAAYKPTDSANNLAAAWHVYNNNTCNSTTCFAGAPATLSATTPIVATEFGENDCAGTIITPWMTWFDGNIVGYLAWTWDTWNPTCVATTTTSSGNPWSLITSYTTATPMAGYAQTVHDHYATF